LKPIRFSNNHKWFFVHNLVSSMDDKIFTAEDVGTHTVVVGVAGFYITYEITVVAEKNKIKIKKE